MAEIAVVIRPHLSETRKSGKMRTSLRGLYNLWKFSHFQDRFWRDAAEIYLRSHIGACTCMHIYMNSAVLVRESVAEKMFIRKAYRR